MSSKVPRCKGAAPPVEFPPGFHHLEARERENGPWATLWLVELGTGKEGEGDDSFKKLKMVQELRLQSSSQSTMSVTMKASKSRSGAHDLLCVLSSQEWPILVSSTRLQESWGLGSVIILGFEPRFASWDHYYYYEHEIS